jgi:hypothetical protein
MSLPEITHLQFLVLDLLLQGEQSGKVLREKMADHGVRKTGPAFYQMMARLEDGRFVHGSYDQKIIDGQIIKERKYRILANGIKAVEQIREFYLSRDLGLRKGLANA